jgi:hypothetical protein
MDMIMAHKLPIPLAGGMPSGKRGTKVGFKRVKSIFLIVLKFFG